MMLNSNVIAASNLDMMSFFKWLAVSGQPAIRRWALIYQKTDKVMGLSREELAAFPLSQKISL